MWPPNVLRIDAARLNRVADGQRDESRPARWAGRARNPELNGARRKWGVGLWKFNSRV
jgi:hypothetical protein